MFNRDEKQEKNLKWQGKAPVQAVKRGNPVQKGRGALKIEGKKMDSKGTLPPELGCKVMGKRLSKEPREVLRRGGRGRVGAVVYQERIRKEG